MIFPQEKLSAKIRNFEILPWDQISSLIYFNLSNRTRKMPKYSYFDFLLDKTGGVLKDYLENEEKGIILVSQ